MDTEVEGRPGREHMDTAPHEVRKPGFPDASLSKMLVLRTFAFSRKV